MCQNGARWSEGNELKIMEEELVMSIKPLDINIKVKDYRSKLLK